MSEYENMRRDYDRMRAAEEEKLKQLGRVEVLQELRELVEKWRRNDVAYTVMHQNSHYGQCAKELEALLASAEDPPCTRCGQKINGPAPRGICGDCTAEGPEQAARERLDRSARFTELLWVLDEFEDKLPTDVRRRIEVRMNKFQRAIERCIDIAEGKEPTT